MKNKLLYIIILLFSCQPDEEIIYNPTLYNIETPYNFPDMNIPLDNPMTEEGILLGKKLFFDNILSANNSISCASCHIQTSGFSDPNQFSISAEGQAGTRNASTLINLGWSNDFFWDGRSNSLENQISGPILNELEFHNISWEEVIVRLTENAEYEQLFCQAFGENDIDSNQVKKAISQFERTLISANSRYDKWDRGEIMFTDAELDGLNIFFTERGDCFHCHGSINFMDNSFHNNALDETFSDLGRFEFTGDLSDQGLFKTPTLRNIEYTGPYMHDGRFSTLEEVIDHYNSGGVYSVTVDPLMKYINTNPYNIPNLTGLLLTESEKSNLKAFLLTLSDEDFMQNPNFQP